MEFLHYPVFFEDAPVSMVFPRRFLQLLLQRKRHLDHMLVCHYIPRCCCNKGLLAFFEPVSLLHTETISHIWVKWNHFIFIMVWFYYYSTIFSWPNSSGVLWSLNFCWASCEVLWPSGFRICSWTSSEVLWLAEVGGRYVVTARSQMRHYGRLAW